MNGYLLVDKPKGWTSFDVVNKVRHIVQNSGLSTSNKKRFPVGHTGTLDPLATGLLVLLLGDYTKRTPGFTKLDKTYEVTMKFGQISTTGDGEGEKTDISDHQPTKIEALDTIKQFEGEIHQIPPAFSAVKVKGRRAYKLARAGKEVEIEPRQVTIYKISNITYEYPKVAFTAHVSSGTYIRTLVGDIGHKLGTGAYMTDLVRTRIGDFRIEEAITVGSLTVEQIYDNLQVLA